MAKLLDFGFNNIELWRSEEMQLVQVGAPSTIAARAPFARPRWTP